MNQIEIDDIKLWIGELVIENKLLQKKIVQIETELIELKQRHEISSDIQPTPDESKSQN